MCWYCWKIYRSRFLTKFKSAEKLQEEFARSVETLRCFKYWRSQSISLMQTNESWSVYIKWGPEDSVRQLVQQLIKSVKVIEPVGEIWDYAAYVREHGDPSKNGHGHKVVTFMGVTGVYVPGKRIWQVERSTTMQAVLNEDMSKPDDLQLSGGQMHLQMDQLFSGFAPPSASGACLEEG